jgi:hypothetical protein
MDRPQVVVLSSHGLLFWPELLQPWNITPIPAERRGV